MAQTEILRLGFGKLLAFYRGMGLGYLDAEELASETSEGVLRGFSRLRDDAAFEGWFWTIARNRFRSRLRARGRQAFEKQYAPVEDPMETVVSREEHSTIRAAMAKLSPRDRAILWLREVEQLTYEEIAGRTGMKAGAIRVAALRARRRIEQIYNDLEPEG